MKLVVEVFISKKSGKKCQALVLDFGYRKTFLSFDSNLVAEILGISVRDLIDADVGVYEINLE